jgi:hypothetical protein
LIVAVSTMQLTRNSNQPAAPESNIASVQTQAPRVVMPSTQPAAPVMRDQIAKAVNRAARQAAPTSGRAFAAPAAERMVASTAVERSVYDAAKGREIKMSSGGVAYGQQLAKSVPVPKTETVAVAF